MRYRLRTLLIVLAIGPILLGGQANAQVGSSYSSIETLVAVSESVFLGTIRETSHQGTDYTFSVAVSEVLKGNPKDGITLTVTDLVRSFDRFEQWRDQQSECLWFLNPTGFVNGTAQGEKWCMLRLNRPVPGEGSFKIYAPPIFSMDFRVLKERDEILNAARYAVTILERSKLKPTEIVTIIIPRSVAQKCRPSGDVNSFAVPIVEELEPIAQRLVVAPQLLHEDFSKPHFEPATLRAAGLKILDKFK